MTPDRWTGRSIRLAPVALALVVLGLTACGSPRNSSAAPSASGRSEDAACPRIDLRTPSGAALDLTGSWRSNENGLFDLNQEDSCLYWLGRSGPLGPEHWTYILAGRIESDFTIDSRWGYVPFESDIDPHALDDGTLTLKIDFDEAEGSESPVLRRVAGECCTGSIWVREESLPAAIELSGAFGGDPTCHWIEADGKRYELIGTGTWVIRNAPVSLQDVTGHIAARVGDPIRVRGQESATMGSGCADSALLVDSLDPGS